MIVVIYSFMRRLNESRAMVDLILVGVMGLFMTVTFEFGFFPFVIGKIEQPRMN